MFTFRNVYQASSKVVLIVLYSKVCQGRCQLQNLNHRVPGVKQSQNPRKIPKILGFGVKIGDFRPKIRDSSFPYTSPTIVFRCKTCLKSVCRIDCRDDDKTAPSFDRRYCGVRENEANPEFFCLKRTLLSKWTLKTKNRWR